MSNDGNKYCHRKGLECQHAFRRVRAYKEKHTRPRIHFPQASTINYNEFEAPFFESAVVYTVLKRLFDAIWEGRSEGVLHHPGVKYPIKGPIY